MSNPGVSLSQYRSTVGWAEEERTAIRNKINEWYRATDDLKTRVSQAYDAMLDNLRIMADLKVFQSMQTPAAPAGTGNGSTGTGSTGTGSTGTGSAGTGSTGSGSSGMQQPPPIDQPEQPEQPDTQPEPPGTGTGTGPQANESVTIEDGDHKITVDSPDGQGHVKVTVDDGTGKPKTYDLDFGSAPSGSPPGTDPVHTLPYPGQPDGSGSGPGSPGQPEPDPGVPGQDPSTPIQAGPDGKCVISDPPLTITAERPAGMDDKVIVTVDDGSGKPTTYTLDYAAGGNGQPIAQPPRPGIPDGEARILPAVDQGPYDAGPRPMAAPMPTEPVNVEGPLMGTDPAQGATVAQGSLQEGAATGFGGTSGGFEAMLSGTPDSGGYTGLSTPNAAGEAGLASAQDGSPAHPTGPSGGMAGGMPMMGGMAAGGGGDDYERAGSAAWRTTGDLFEVDDDYEPARFGVLEPDDPGARR